MSGQPNFPSCAARSVRTALTCATWFAGSNAISLNTLDCFNRLIIAATATMASGCGGDEGRTASNPAVTSSAKTFHSSQARRVSPSSARASTSRALSLSVATKAPTVLRKSLTRSWEARTARLCSKIAIAMAAAKATVPTTVEIRSNHSDRVRLANQRAIAWHMLRSMPRRHSFGEVTA